MQCCLYGAQVHPARRKVIPTHKNGCVNKLSQTGVGVLPYISYIGMCHLSKKARHSDFRQPLVLHDINII